MLNLSYRVTLFFILFFVISSKLGLGENEASLEKKVNVPFLIEQSAWVDSLMNAMTLEEKVGQLFMLAVYSNKNAKYENEILEQVQKFQIGGIIFMQGGPVRQAVLNNKIQQQAKIPLMIGIDAEYGLAMRLDSTIQYPSAISVGATKNDQLAYDLGAEIARQFNLLNININFAPVVDINNNPENPIINVRSFGQDKYLVTRKGLAFAMGMQDQRVLAVAKHFPGHGDTNKDSHQTLPEVNHSKEQLFNEDIYPFKTLIDNGIGGVMVAHLSVPEINQKSMEPVSLSRNVVDGILKNQLGFHGLVFTDALNMKGVTRDFSIGEIEIKALLAGNDVLLFPENIEVAIREVTTAVQNGTVSRDLVEEKCRKILMAKYWFGLNHYQPVDTTDLVDRLNNIPAKKIKTDIINQSITQISGNNSLVPLMHLKGKRILAVSLGESNTEFNVMLNKYTQVDTINLPVNFSIELKNSILQSAKSYDVIILSKHNIVNSSSNYFGLTPNELDFIGAINSANNVILVWMGTPYGLKQITDRCRLNTILLGYNNFQETNSKIAQAIFGGIKVEGILPVSISSSYPSGLGKISDTAIRLAYIEPYELGLSDSSFKRVDSIINAALAMKAMPGGQVLYAIHGKVVYERNFGFADYENKQPVTSNYIYDIASVTKLAATTISVMNLYDHHNFNLTSKLSHYLPELKESDKKNVRLDDLLAHQAKLHTWIPFYKNTLDDKGNPRSDLYKKQSDDLYSIKICDNMYLRNDYVDSMYKAILDTPLYKSKKYRYSDLGFYYLARFVKQLSGVPIDRFADSVFYAPLGMNYTCYNPLRYFDKNQIIPTEDDQYFRKTIVRGYVHDPGAAMLGGVSGHAGLFSTANDMAKLGQLLLNKGKYGGETFFSEETFGIFNNSRFKIRHNRRGLGFDKPALKEDEPGPTCNLASHQSFGHTGFTGAYFWVDPQNQSVFVFLSNRTFPSQSNNKIVEFNIRTEIQQEFYHVFTGN